MVLWHQGKRIHKRNLNELVFQKDPDDLQSPPAKCMYITYNTYRATSLIRYFELVGSSIIIYFHIMQTLNRLFLLTFLFLGTLACQTEQPSAETSTPEGHTLYYPARDLGELFEQIQTTKVFDDGKYFVDFSPKRNPADILMDYQAQKDEADFDLKAFVMANFDEPTMPEAKPIDSKPSLEEHIPNHWDYLTRSSDEINGYSSLLPLPGPYVVPGGRFREIYYWDSYFTMIGLGATGRTDLMKSMINNFAYLIDEVGFIPNGNRSYFLGRSQPPFFSAMVNLLAQYDGDSSALKYLPAMQKEYDFWMAGTDQLKEAGDAHRRVVMMEDGVILNRYFDDKAEPRSESYAEDVELAHGMNEEEKTQLFRDLRAACESGWDFSSRWFAVEKDFSTIITTQLLPVDLNSLIYNMEVNLSKYYNVQGDMDKSEQYAQAAEQRKAAILNYFWNEAAGMYTDYNFQTSTLSERKTLAGLYPLYFNVSDDEKAAKTKTTIENEFALPGGVTTTLVESGQQWDYPNGWAPLQWMTIKGLEHYDHTDLASTISSNWVNVNRKVFDNTQKMMEKYNVSDTTLLAGGGEYPNQDGFGWTNGIVISLIKGVEKY